MAKLKLNSTKKRGRKKWQTSFKTLLPVKDSFEQHAHAMRKAGVFAAVKKNRKKINWCKSFIAPTYEETGDKIKTFNNVAKRKRNKFGYGFSKMKNKYIRWKKK